MSLLSLLVLAGTALAWATLDAMRKHIAGDVDAIPLALALALGSVPMFAVWSGVEGLVLPELAYLPWALGSTLGNLGGAVLLLVALRVAPLSVVIPSLSLSPVFSAMLGLALLGEWPEPLQWGGMACILGGAALLAFTGEGRASLRGLGLGATVAACFAGAVVFDKGALDYVGVGQHGLVLMLLMALGLLVVLTVQGRLSRLHGLVAHGGWVLGACATMAAAIGLQLVALQLWLVPVVEGTKRAIGLTASIVIGRVAFGESVTLPKVIAIVLMIAGVAGMV